MKNNDEATVWPDYLQHLISERGLTPRSARTYISHARTIIRQVEPVTDEALKHWIAGIPETSRSAYTGAWRSYVAFMARLYPNITMGTFPPKTRSIKLTVPEVVLRACLLAMHNGVTIPDVCAARYGLDPIKYERLCSAIPAVHAGRQIAFTKPGAGVVILPAVVVADLALWAGTSADGALLLPHSPTMPETPMPPTKLTRLIKAMMKADAAARLP